MIAVDYNKCLKCSGCVGICPVNALTLKDRLECDKKCINCGLCVAFCPIGALSLKGDIDNVPRNTGKG